MSGERTPQRTIAVTGGGRGIGRACALRQARAGDRVLVWDLDRAAAEAVAAEIAAEGLAAQASALDVADTQAARRAIAEAGPLDGLVHAAGVTRTIALPDIDEAEYDRVMDVNLRGAFFVTRAAADALRAAGGGAIVLFSSCSGRKPRPFSAHYAASKAALINLTGSAALAYGPEVRVNAVCPGVIVTDMNRQIARERHELFGYDVDDAYPGLAESLALKRLGEPDDVARVVEFLLGPLAQYVTGQSINVDGGMEFS